MSEDTEERPILLFPEYDAPMEELLSESIYQFAIREDPFLAQIKRVKTAFLAAPSGVGHGRTFGGQQLQLTGTPTYEESLQTNLEAWSSFVHSMGVQQARQLARMLFASMDEATTEAGTNVDLGGQPLSHDRIFDLFESMEFEVDDNLEPIGLTIVTSPETADAMKKLQPLTPAQEERRKAIMLEKRRIQDAKKRTRKLD